MRPYPVSSNALCSARTAFGTCFSSIRHVIRISLVVISSNVHLRVVQRPEHPPRVACPRCLTVCGKMEREGKTMKFDRITVEAEKMSGLPCIRGLRIPVATIVAMVADGMPEAEILAAYPDLEPEDIREALHFAAEAVKERALPLTGGH